MIKQHGFDDPLQQVDPQVAASQMRKLVGDHRFEQIQRHFGSPRRGNENQRANQADRHRFAHLPADKYSDSRAEIQSSAKLRGKRLQLLRKRLATTAQLDNAYGACDQSAAQENNT